MQYQDPKNWKAPETFEEYIERFPDYHKKWLMKRYSPFSNPDFDDVAQYLILETFRKKRVEKFNPFRKGLINRPGLFFDWMKRCFNRDLATLLAERKRHVRRANHAALSLSGHSSDGRVISGDTLLIQKVQALGTNGSSEYKRATEYEGERIIENVRIREFRDYVKKHARFLVKHIDAMPIGEHDGKKHNPVHAKLRALAKAFREGKKPPKIKKPYRPRKAKAVE